MEIITGDKCGNIIVWDINTGKIIKIWEAHKSGITTIKINESKKILITSSEDGYIKQWQIPEKWGIDYEIEISEDKEESLEDELSGWENKNK